MNDVCAACHREIADSTIDALVWFVEDDDGVARHIECPVQVLPKWKQLELPTTEGDANGH